VTAVNVIKNDTIVHEKLMNLMRNTHGDDILVVWNKKSGSLPKDNRSVIKIKIPAEPELKYNR
jgi:hypothetical protein